MPGVVHGSLGGPNNGTRKTNNDSPTSRVNSDGKPVPTVTNRPRLAEVETSTNGGKPSTRSEVNSSFSQNGAHGVGERQDRRGSISPVTGKGNERNWQLRHGWDEQYNSEEYLHLLSSAFYMYYTEKRHETDGKPRLNDSARPPRDWALKDKTKTMAAALVVCLNLGVNPPDVVKPNPCATTECWIDPSSMTTTNLKILEAIGKKLQEQLEILSPKPRYKQYLDPSYDETKRFCTALRRNAKDERVLLYYNGHGVPRPTPSGEIWVFNRDYTQYIPVALYDLQSWLAGPSLLIYDCSHAGNVIANYERYVQKHEDENKEIKARDPTAQVQNYGGNIHLAACSKTELLPTSPDLPADLFTCCLTTPIDISLRFHVMQNLLRQPDVSFEDISKVPGTAKERKSPMGELNWILTAITDTIAWNALPRELFRKLFRQDLMVAALFRNYLVAERIMTAHGCHPVTIPKMPSTHEHPLWESWDLAIEMVISQLPDLIASANGGPPYEYKPSNFFGEQLTAFEHYLQQGAPKKEPPTQLPVVLQVLLSQAHRLKALMLLSRFFDLGPWAVNLALTIGIFPYVVKLLQSPALELKPIMIFIWARIIAVAGNDAQPDLLRDNNYAYFTNVLVPGFTIPIENMLDHKAMCAFVTAMFCRDFLQAQETCYRTNVMESLAEHLHNGESHLLREWACLAISMLWKNYPEGKWAGIRNGAHIRLCTLLVDHIPEVRTAAIHALTNFLGIPDLTEAVAQNEELVASALMAMVSDGTVMVRKELVVFYSVFVKRYKHKFLVAAFESLVEERDRLQEGRSYSKVGAFDERGFMTNGNCGTGSALENDSPLKNSKDSTQGAMWYQLITMTTDSQPEVAEAATKVVNWVLYTLLKSPLGPEVQPVMEAILDLSNFAKLKTGSRAPSAAPSARPSRASSPTPTVDSTHSVNRNEGYLSIGFRRTASVAAALKYFVAGKAQESRAGNAPTESAGNETQSRSMPRTNGRNSRSLPEEWARGTKARPYQHLDVIATSRAGTSAADILGGFRDMGKSDQEIASALPLPSCFMEYSIEYFLEPQMKTTESEEPGSDEHNRRLWRRGRNENILTVTQKLKATAGSSEWNIDAGFFNNGVSPTCMTFHQFEDHLAVADDRDGITIWNWRTKTRLAMFSNGNPRGSRINETRFINEDDVALLMTGSSDGVVKIFRNYDEASGTTDKSVALLPGAKEDCMVELVTAFRALTDMVPSTKNAGLVFDWQQGQGRLLVAGDVKVIRVWNASTEICVTDIPARSGSCITSLTSDQVAGSIFAAGYGDGAVRIFDQRLRPSSAQVRVWREQKQWISNVHMQRGGQRELISGSRDGQIRLWDIRMEKSIKQIRAPGTLKTMIVHEHAPVFATGSENHALTLYNTDGTFLSTIHPYSPLLSTNRSTPIACAAFHPHRMLLTVGCAGSTWVNAYTCGEGRGFAS